MLKQNALQRVSNTGPLVVTRRSTLSAEPTHHPPHKETVYPEPIMGMFEQ